MPSTQSNSSSLDVIFRINDAVARHLGHASQVMPTELGLRAMAPSAGVKIGDHVHVTFRPTLANHVAGLAGVVVDGRVSSFVEGRRGLQLKVQVGDLRDDEAGRWGAM